MAGFATLRPPALLAAPPTRALLRRLDLFAALAPDVLDDISRAAISRRWGQGPQLFAKGDGIARELFILQRGTVRLSMLSAPGRKLSLRHLGAGEVLGEIAALSGTPCTATATAVSDVEALALPADTVVRAVSTDAAAAMAAMRMLCERLRRTTEQLESEALYGVETRLAQFMLWIAAERDGRAEVILALTHEQQAEMIGASRPKVRKTLPRLERDGALLRKGARYALDLNLLRTLAHGVA